MYKRYSKKVFGITTLVLSAFLLVSIVLAATSVRYDFTSVGDTADVLSD